MRSATARPWIGWMCAAIAAASAGEPDCIEIDRVWAGHPVGFCLLTAPPDQYAAYYDRDRWMTVAQRRLGETNWTRTRLPSQLGWDSHNYVTMALDASGRLHIAGNLHVSPLTYFRSRKPRNAATLERQTAMVGDRESRMTYPVFFRDRDGRLLFRYRDGRSGGGDDVYNAWDEEAGRWRRWLDTPLISGGGRRNAYASVPAVGPDGRFHMVWVWRDSPDCASNHSLSYARSDDLRHWTDSGGRPLPLPMTLETCEVVDPVPPAGGLLNGNAHLGFDRAGHPVVTYHKYDGRGDLQIFAARREADRWRIVQVSDWKDYRWEFKGGGTIVAEVRLGQVEPGPPGRLLLTYRYGRGSGIWVLDEATLRPCPGETAPRRTGDGLPAAARRVESGFPGMEKRHAVDIGAPPVGARYVLSWETLPANRDRQRDPPHPEPSPLRLYRVAVP